MKRNEQLLENTWRLSDIFEDETEFEKTLNLIKVKSDELTAYSGKLDDPEMLLAFLKGYETICVYLDDVYGYASLLSDQDTTDAHAQQLKSKAYDAYVDVSTKLAFSDVEIMQISDIETFFEKEPIIERYRIYLDELRRMKDHILSKEEEKLLSSSDMISSGFYEIYMMLNNADLKFEAAIDKDGKQHPLTSGTYIHLLKSDDEQLRRSAYENLYSGYGSIIHGLASCLNGQTKQLLFNSKARNYASSLECAVDSNHVSSKVYEQLISTVHENIDVLHKYMRVRKQLMHKDKLHMYDLYVPLVTSCNVQIPFEKAKQDVYRSIQLYGNEYATVYKHGLDDRWIDIYENEGKRSGAYSSGMKVHPYVLMSYADTLDSEFTLAHEMGHAMHSYFSTKYQAPLDRHYKIFVAEVASTCNEALLMDHLRRNNEDKQVEAYLINHFLEQFRTTLFRQCMFAEFEKIINEKTARGEALSSDVLNQIYRDLNVYYYGDDVIVDDNIAMEWARIPHFYMNFYVYQYATGFSAAMTLSQKLLHGTQTDVDNYLDFLKGGCTMDPVSLLKVAGVDMTTSRPIEAAIALFDQLIDEFAALMV